MHKSVVQFRLQWVAIAAALLSTSAVAAPAPVPPPEVIRVQLDPKRADLLLVVATDMMFVRHYTQDRKIKLQELEINSSLQPFNEKLKVLVGIRRKEMAECLKSAASVQTNFTTAYDQLDAARYEVRDYKAMREYEKKNRAIYQDKDILSAAEIARWTSMRPKGFIFNNICMDDGKIERPTFVSPNTPQKRN